MIKLSRLLEYGKSDKDSVIAAIDEIRSLGYKNPFDNSTIINNYVSVEIGNFDGHLWVSSIYTPAENRHKGLAKDVMIKMCDIADKHGVYMGLDAIPFGDKKDALNKTKLIKFYKSFGFKPVSGIYERAPKIS
jgi:GNAT superfamily N-acetyltransferase